jgi:nucleoside-diphosphate-sugar epimerase
MAEAKPRAAAPVVLVTGATGFVGSEIVRSLAATGARVRAAVRAPSTTIEGVDCVPVGDIAADVDWSRALAGVDAVVHAAARVHAMGAAARDERAFVAVNVTATERLARACATAGVRRLVFLSSVKVNGEATIDRPFTADDAPRPDDAYGRSKLEAERALFRIAAETGLEVAIVRPPLVYGPGVGANFARLMNLVRRGVPLPLGSVRNRRSLVGVWNLADFVVQVVRADAAAGRVWMISDGEDLSTGDLVRRLAQAMGRSPRLVPVPVPVLRALGALTGRGAEVRRLIESLQVDATPATRELGWRPIVDVDTALRRTVSVGRPHLREH